MKTKNLLRLIAVLLGACCAYSAQSMPESGRFIPKDGYDWALLLTVALMGALVGGLLLYVFLRYIMLRALMRENDHSACFKTFARVTFEMIFVWTQFGLGFGAFVFALAQHSYEAIFMPGLVALGWGFAAMKAFRSAESQEPQTV